MRSEELIPRFRDIVENIDWIEKHIDGMSEGDYAGDRLVTDAVERCLQRITEASIRVQPFGAETFPMQDWADMRKLGNLLRHGYEVVRTEMVWRIVKVDLPALRTDCLRAIAMLERG